MLKKIIQTRLLIRNLSKSRGIILTNNTWRKKYFLCIKPFLFKNQQIQLELEEEIAYGSNCAVKLLNKNLKPAHDLKTNCKNIINNLNGRFFVFFIVQPKSKIIFKSVRLSQEVKSFNVADHMIGDKLLISPGYPSNNNKYSYAFIHTRMQKYIELGWSIDLLTVDHCDDNLIQIYDFQNVRVVNVSYNQLRNLLYVKRYKQILIHFFDEKHAQILDAIDTSETKIFLYSHGAETLYWDFGKINREYFSKEKEINDSLRKNFLEKDTVIKRYSSIPNVKWVFVTDFTKKRCQELLKINFSNSCVIPCLIDEKKFYFTKRNKKHRKKICIIRKFDNINSYSIDIDVRVILELSKRECFKDLEFSIYGDGPMHSVLLAPVKKFKNVNIFKKFLTHEEMAEMYNQHGIALFATRYDSQAVASCEAAMTGAAVITSKNVGVTQFIDPKLGTYCDTENFTQYADLIEYYYNHPNSFLKLGSKMRESVLATCGYQQTIAKDIALIENNKNTKLLKYEYKEPIDNPILTIVVPSYNVEKFLKNSIFSLINQPLSYKIEVLIINDGSKDNTAKIGKELQDLTTINKKSIVRLINKKNGGHGSTINVGIKEARGKYFKLMDGDDYFVTSELIKLIKILEKEDNDIVLNDYIEDSSVDATKKLAKHYDFMEPGQSYDLDTLSYEGYGFSSQGPLLPTTTCKTSLLKKANFKLDEHCFYVDMEFNFIIYAISETVVYHPLDIYNYYLGRTDQSVSNESIKKNCSSREKVCIRLLDEFEKRKHQITPGKQKYLLKNIVLMMSSLQYEIAMNYFKNGKNFRSFDKKLKKYDFYYNQITGSVLKIHRLTNGRLIFMNSLFINLKKAIRRGDRV